MGRVAATAVHLTLSAVAIALYVLFVIPRWWELMGDTSPALGTVLRIVAGLFFAAAALPVVMTLVRTKKSELPTPQLAQNLRLSAAISHVMAGALIVAAAIAEIWVSYDTAGVWLGGVYGVAAALATLGIAGFYLAFVADLPPATPKDKKAKSSAPQTQADGTQAGVSTGTEAADTDSDTESSPAESSADTSEDDESAGAAAEEPSDESAVSDESSNESASDEPADAPAGFRNKRPSGKSGHRLRLRQRTNVSAED